MQGECQHDDECSDQEACENYYCINPCKTGTCQQDYFCVVIRHVPTCGKKFVPEPQEVFLSTFKNRPIMGLTEVTCSTNGL